MQKLIVTILHTELKFVHFWIFLSKFSCYGNSLCSLKILVSIFEFTNPVEVKFVQFWLIFKVSRLLGDSMGHSNLQ